MLQVMHRFSVLLLYPAYMNEGGTETYYAHILAPHARYAAGVAQKEAAEAQKEYRDDVKPEDFTPLLVLRGHIEGELIEGFNHA